MSNSADTIRNYQPGDFDNYLRLITAAEKLAPAGRCTSAEALTEHLGRPNYSAGQDLFIAELAGDIIGYMDVTAELTISRVIVDCWVCPEHRRRGLARKLLGYATRRAKEIGARVAQVNIAEDNAVASRVLSRLGFNPVRRFLELRLNITDIHWPDTDQAALQCRYLQPGEEDRLTQIQNRAFAGAWGYNPNTVETITYQTNSSACSPGDIILVYQGDKVIGYCWTGVAGDGEAGSQRNGRIFMLGVDRDYRGKGTGKQVLLAGLACLQGKGVQVAELTVDSENKTACALYESIGFRVQTSSYWYQKVIS